MQRSSAAQAAMERGEAAEQRGSLLAARGAYQLAQRLAPSDRHITMAVGRVRLALGDPQASEPFELVARQDDVRDAWICLAGVRLRFGRPDLAASELHEALSRHAPPGTPAFALFCEEVLRATKRRPGWCGLTADGVLRIGLRPDRAPGGLAVTLDGEPVTLPAAGLGQRVALPEAWRGAKQLVALHNGQALIGSPVSVASIARCEGFVATAGGGIEGWAWMPGDPEHEPALTIRDAAGCVRLRIVATEPAAVAHPTPGARPRAFSVPVGALDGVEGIVTVHGPDGRQLTGSPLDPGLERRSAALACESVRRLFPAGPHPAEPAAPGMPAVPADIVGAPPRDPALRRPVDVEIPAYRGLEETLSCIASASASLPRGARLVVVDDASPDPALAAALDELAAQRRIVLHRLPANRGFPAAANAGLRAAAGRDVVLLNSDTLCPPGWLARLRAAAYAAPDIGTVTPLSNDATVMSYPVPGDGNPVPDGEEVRRLDALARAACGGVLVDLPTAIGFCMYIRRDCLDQVGLLREDVFAQGYGEENDFCLRARHLGWRHVGLPGLFVGHVGGRSFGAAKTHLMARNLRVVERLHPGYQALVEGWCAADPMAPHRRAIDAARWGEKRRASSVILLTHAREGGVRRRVAERCARLAAEGVRPVVLIPRRLGGKMVCLVSDGMAAEYPNLGFVLPDELDELVALLRAEAPRSVEIHHFIGHHPALLDLPARLGVPSEAVLHDYAWFCPRINLVGAGRRYCGEPDPDACESCVRDLGPTIEDDIRPGALLARSARVLGAARRVVAPSTDAARRYRRHLPHLRPEVEAWEDDALPPPPPTATRGALRVAVVGAIGIEKGYEVLLACAREAAARRRPMSFAVIGHTCDDARLLEVGNVSITGPYAEAEAEALIRAEAPALGFLPSLWPETWCYTLSASWRAGLRVLAFDIGAPAERIRATGRGWLLPLGAAPGVVNDALLSAFRQIQGQSAA